MTAPWFHSDDKIEFRKNKDDSGGCKWVLKQVEEQRGSYGIIDRDYLLNPEHYELFFETDDEIFKNTAPFGPNVLILSRYEIENYLVDVPHILRIMLNRRRNTYNGRTINSESELCEILLNISLKISSVDAICTVFRLFREEIPGKVKGLYFDINSVDEVILQVNGLLREWIEEKCEILEEPGHTNLFRCVCECYEQLVDHYCVFSSNEKDPIKRFLSLLRVVDGKRLLELITRSFRIHDPIEYDLADYVVDSDTIPVEIDSFINSIRFDGI